MQYVLLAEHSPEVCPTSNKAMREAMMKSGPAIPEHAKKNGVKIHAGPFVSREHLIITVVEADKGEALDRFIFESGMEQWNKVRIIPVQHLGDGMKELSQSPTLF